MGGIRWAQNRPHCGGPGGPRVLAGPRSGPCLRKRPAWPHQQAQQTRGGIGDRTGSCPDLKAAQKVDWPAAGLLCICAASALEWARVPWAGVAGVGLPAAGAIHKLSEIMDGLCTAGPT